MDRAGIIGGTDNTVAIMTEIRGYTEYDSYTNFKYVGYLLNYGEVTINDIRYTRGVNDIGEAGHMLDNRE